MSDDDLLFGDEPLEFAEESEEDSNAEGEKWKILVIDDEENVHAATRIALRGKNLEGREIEIVHGYSGKEAKLLLEKNTDCALLLLDVVMDSTHAGLEVVKFLREELKNKFLRVILRTGQPGTAPELDTVLNYDIDGYRSKEELTEQRLVSTVVTSLRSFKRLHEIHSKNEDLAELNKQLVDINKNLEYKVEKQTEAYAKALEQIFANEKLLSLGRIVAGVAHELKTPISNALTLTGAFENNVAYIENILREKNVADPEFEEIFEDNREVSRIISKNIQRANELINSFKRVSVNQASEREDTFKLIAYLKDEVLFSLSHKLRQEQISVDVKGDEVEITSYPGIFSQVFTNLIENSINHAYEKKGGKIDIKFVKDGNNMKIDFTDYGSGIADSDIERVFDPFFTTGGLSGDGSGLGLPVIYNLVQSKLMGTMSCKSKEGEFTTFTINFPL